MVQHIASMQEQCWTQEGTGTDRHDDTLNILSERAQNVWGFGGCFNELGWDALNRTSTGQRDIILDEFFGQAGCAFNYGRVPIGANDFSLEWYSCDEVRDDTSLAHFNIERDKRHTIPFIREAQKRQPELFVFASPWSPPTWMKTKPVYNFGTLRMEPEILDAYARYFLRFVQAYAEQGIPVRQIHVQNEPMADQKFPSCKWSGEDMRVFIRDYLGPVFSEAGLDVEIWLGTINGPFLDYQMGTNTPFSEFYDQFANTILSDPQARRHIAGVGLQWGGKHVLEQIHLGYPELRIMQTESECGDGMNSWEHMEYVFGLMWQYFRHGAERYTYWNLALPEGGESSWGWKQNSLVTVSPVTGEVKWQPEYYLMKHVSHFVKPGARVAMTSGRWTPNAIAFENPDGTLVVVVSNAMHRSRPLTICWHNQTVSAEIAAHSLHSFVLSPEGDC